jgi:multiple sugar transport system substrate-binding protein
MPIPQNQNIPNNSSTTSQKGQLLKDLIIQNKFIVFTLLGLIITALIIGIILVFLPKQQTVVETPVTIKFWTRSINQEVMENIIRDFEAENPLIKVKLEVQSDTDYKNRIITRLTSSSPNMGDIVEIDESWIDEVYTQLLPITSNTILSRYTKTILDNNTLNTLVYGVPFRFNSLVIAYNRDHLAEINFTEADFNKLDWTGLAIKAKSITKTEKTINSDKKQIEKIIRSGAAIGSPKNVTNAKDILKLLIMQNNASFYDSKTKKYALDSKFEEALKFYTEFTTQKIWDDSLGNDIKTFAEGKTSIVIVNSKDIDEIIRLNPNLNFATAIPPQISTIRNLSLSQSLVIPSYLPYYEQSVKFLEFLTRPENSIKLFEAKGSDTFIPAQITALNKIPKGSYFAVFADINPTAQRIKTHNQETVDEIIDKYLRGVYDGYYKDLAQKSGKIELKFKSEELEQMLNSSIPRPTNL